MVIKSRFPDRNSTVPIFILAIVAGLAIALFSSKTLITMIAVDQSIRVMTVSMKTLQSNPLDLIVPATKWQDQEKEEKADRMAYYKTRYQYQPPQGTAAFTTRSETDAVCGSHPQYDKWFALDYHKRSRKNEDRLIYETFFKTDNSSRPQEETYVEIGAYDGSQESNTNFFDTCLGWSGLLVEGNPIMWNRLSQNRPQAHRMSYVPSCSLQEQKSNKTIPFHPIGSTNTGVEAQDRGVHLVYNRRSDFVQVPCGSLWQVLVDIFPQQGHVSFWSLDVEGSEHLILEHMDFDKVFIELLMVEVKNSFCHPQKPCEARDKSREILQRQGYLRFSGKVHASDIFIHPQSFRLLERATKAGWIPTTGA